MSPKRWPESSQAALTAWSRSAPGASPPESGPGPRCRSSPSMRLPCPRPSTSWCQWHGPRSVCELHPARTPTPLAKRSRRISWSNAPWGTRLEFFHEEQGDATSLDMDTFAVEAWTAAFEEAFGNEPIHMGAGGSIPFISTFSEMYPGVPILVIGTSDPTSSYHAPNESQDLADLGKAVLAEAIAFRLIAERISVTRRSRSAATPRTPRLPPSWRG